MATAEKNTFYLVNYRDPKDGKVVSLKAKKIMDSSLGLSFVSISDFVFEQSGILVNPEEEAKKLEFEHVKNLHLSIYSILSIAEIGEHPGTLRFENDKAKLLVLNPDQHDTPPN